MNLALSDKFVLVMPRPAVGVHFFPLCKACGKRSLLNTDSTTQGVPKNAIRGDEPFQIS